MNSSLHQAVERAGGPTAFARLLGISPQRVTNWLARGVPAEHCPDVERVTGGATRCEELRPDVDWAVLRASA